MAQKKITILIDDEERKGKGVLACYVIDASGSMLGMKQQVISGFNEWLETVKNEKAVDFVTLTVFNTEVETIYRAVPIDKVSPLTESVYRPSGFTALHDGIVQSINDTDRELRNREIEKALVIIMTDGAENSSKHNDLNSVRRLIERKESQGNWTFTFLGATPDAYNVGGQFGIARGNIVQYNVDRSDNVFRGLASNTVAYSKSAVGASSAFLENMNADGDIVKDYVDTGNSSDGGSK